MLITLRMPITIMLMLITQAADAEHNLDDYCVNADVNADVADCTSYLPLSWNLSPFLNQRTLTFSLFILQKLHITLHPAKVRS